MILRFRPGTEPDVVLTVERDAAADGCRTVRSPEPRRPIVALPDKPSPALVERLRAHPAIEEVIKPSTPGLQVTRAFRDGPTVVRIGDLLVGPDQPCLVIAGPCSVEGREAVMENAHRVAEAGATMLRGGAYKPRTSPYSFQGFGAEGLRQLKDAGDAVGLPIISEIMDPAHLPIFLDAGVDCLQIGARNMQNFALLKAVGAAGRPVLLKRGLAATVQEWLLAAEYLLAGGTDQVILCERGIRTFETATRNTLDLTVLPLLRQWTHLPIVVDPAHAAGIASLIPTLCRASVAAGADGLAVEVHLNPSEARSDGPQALLPGELKQVCAETTILRALFAHA